MARVRVNVRGVERTLQKLMRKGKAFKKAMAAALYTEALALDAEMVPLIPVATGRLRGSHYVTKPRGPIDNPRVEVGVGTNYGIYVHENLEAQHPVGQAKFLEQPYKARRSGYVKRVANATENYARMGIGMESIPATAPESPSE